MAIADLEFLAIQEHQDFLEYQAILEYQVFQVTLEYLAIVAFLVILEVVYQAIQVIADSQVNLEHQLLGIAAFLVSLVTLDLAEAEFQAIQDIAEAELVDFQAHQE